jgi:hypothetical protein
MSMYMSSGPSTEQTAHWSGIKPYLDVNAHIRAVDRGKHAPKSGLEKRVDVAISRGNYAAAETLSDDLATREVS